LKPERALSPVWLMVMSVSAVIDHKGHVLVCDNFDVATCGRVILRERRGGGLGEGG